MRYSPNEACTPPNKALQRTGAKALAREGAAAALSLFCGCRGRASSEQRPLLNADR